MFRGYEEISLEGMEVFFFFCRVVYIWIGNWKYFENWFYLKIVGGLLFIYFFLSNNKVVFRGI